MLVNPTKCHVGVHRRESCRTCVEDCGGRLLGKRHVDSVMIDDLARAGDVSNTPTDDVINARETGSADPLSSSPILAQSDDVSVATDEDGTRPLSLAPIIDYRNSLPRFEPRPATAYRRHSSRMFFYDRLRCTHDSSDIESTSQAQMVQTKPLEQNEIYDDPQM